MVHYLNFDKIYIINILHVSAYKTIKNIERRNYVFTLYTLFLFSLCL